MWRTTFWYFWDFSPKSHVTRSSVSCYPVKIRSKFIIKSIVQTQKHCAASLMYIITECPGIHETNHPWIVVYTCYYRLALILSSCFWLLFQSDCFRCSTFHIRFYVLHVPRDVLVVPFFSLAIPSYPIRQSFIQAASQPVRQSTSQPAIHPVNPAYVATDNVE